MIKPTLSFVASLVLSLTICKETSSFGTWSHARRPLSSATTFSSSLSAQTDFQAPVNVEETRIHLDSGIDAQVFIGRSSSSKRTRLPPLVFIHGSFHAGWCWTERFFPYFMDLGYNVVTLSLRGTGGTFAGDGVKKVLVDEHAQDVKSFLDALPDLLGSKKETVKPILISHSFGGLAVMKLLETNPESAVNLSGVVIMCSVPPSGNGKMTMRFLKRSLVDSWKITAGFAMKRCIKNDSLCRDLFFGGTNDDNGVSDQDIARYQEYFARDTEATIDIKDLLKNLPSMNAVDGKAPHLDKFPPCLVIGAERDFIVDREGVEETAVYFGAAPPTYVDSPHDVMLGRNWENTASTINNWVQTTVVNQ